MNGEQFKYLICTKYNIDTRFWAPEIACNKFKMTNVANHNDIYQIALIVLVDNCESFKNRMNGLIQDDWINKTKFSPIVNECVDILKTFNDPKLHMKMLNLESWQQELLNLFMSFQ